MFPCPFPDNDATFSSASERQWEERATTSLIKRLDMILDGDPDLTKCVHYHGLTPTSIIHDHKDESGQVRFKESFGSVEVLELDLTREHWIDYESEERLQSDDCNALRQSIKLDRGGRSAEMIRRSARGAQIQIWGCCIASQTVVTVI
ncbi:hypothetical protein CC1G_13596 [Coprinopsis cinerea okayama7|uniref:Uncharacterized protein n=1 Tax=Coprinopsis cinerea (strain Okayama-7 / 130 / ATCC MYA-4618 / FGSC 9003) TaxID=240176 RepID=D6RJU3_COPC7|nr:hypothetical protein CC1G_13596 [Coprinopsis cinerea okayama7\|eukprot:XP_002912063.1 hypothetical protein CC1G_13596 [Coprinopsis cinerea okayama7\